MIVIYSFTSGHTSPWYDKMKLGRHPPTLRGVRSRCWKQSIRSNTPHLPQNSLSYQPFADCCLFAPLLSSFRLANTPTISTILSSIQAGICCTPQQFAYAIIQNIIKSKKKKKKIKKFYNQLPECFPSHTVCERYVVRERYIMWAQNFHLLQTPFFCHYLLKRLLL